MENNPLFAPKTGSDSTPHICLSSVWNQRENEIALEPMLLARCLTNGREPFSDAQCFYFYGYFSFHFITNLVIHIAVGTCGMYLNSWMF